MLRPETVQEKGVGKDRDLGKVMVLPAVMAKVLAPEKVWARVPVSVMVRGLEMAKAMEMV
jgi:hypothetical protein